MSRVAHSFFISRTRSKVIKRYNAIETKLDIQFMHEDIQNYEIKVITVGTRVSMWMFMYNTNI